jgi:hypothetical protein
MPRRVMNDPALNVERRLTSVEQILPTLATKMDLETAIAPLATKAELAVVSNELRAEIRDAAERTVHRVEVLTETIRADVRGNPRAH